MKSIDVFIDLLRELQKIDTEFPLQYALSLSLIAMNEGLSLTELAKKAGMSLSTTSRIVGALSRHRQSGQAYELVYVQVSEQERRRKEIYLTDKGRYIIEGLQKIMSDFSAAPEKAAVRA